MDFLRMFFIQRLIILLMLAFSSISVYSADEAPFHIAHSSVDVDYAKDLDLLFTELSKNQLKKKYVDNLAKYQGRNHSFDIMLPVIDRLNLVVAIKDQDGFYKNCGITNKSITPYTESIATRFHITIDKYCRYLFLQRLTALSANINFSTRDLAYFKEASPFFAIGENQPELIMLLKHYRPNPTELEKLSNILIEKFIDYKLKPSSSVLTNLKVNIQFNKFLQNNLDLDDYSNSFFHDELQRLSRDAQDAAERGDAMLSRSIIISAINFYLKNKNFIQPHKAWNGVILTAKALFYKGYDNDAIEIFNLAKTIAPKEDWSETHFYLMWPHIINRNYVALKTAIEKHNIEKNFDKFETKVQYWTAISILKNGDNKKAITMLNKIISNSPYTFYSIIALKELANQSKSNGLNESDVLSKLISKQEPLDIPFEKTSNILQDSLRRYSIWSKLGNERFTTLELRFIQSLSKEEAFRDREFARALTPSIAKEYLITNTIRLLNSQKRYVTSFKVFQDSLEQNSLTLNYKLMKLIFPLNYFDIVKKNAENLDPIIIISLIRQESAFNPEAKSGVGAKGLMQLMPATAKRFNRRVKVRHLGNPDINVAIGIKYLKVLLNRFDGNLIFALASYNAGENRVDRWRKDLFRNSDPLATIESIPFEETRNYVKLIYRNNFFYSLLSNRPVLTTSLEESFKIESNGKNF